MSKDTHKLMLQHSQAKVHLYGNYLAKYLHVICQDKNTTGIYLYDLFCGQGIYDDGDKGSPMIALDKIRECYSKFEKMPAIKIMFNDNKKEVIEKLKDALSKYNTPSQCKVEIHNVNYVDLLNQVNSEIQKFKKEKAVIFLDPKGYKDISITHIKELLKGGKSEVLVFLPIRDMHRFAQMDKSNITAAHEPLYKFIAEVFPDDVPQFDSQIDFIRKTKEGLKKIMPNCFVDTFTLERDQGQFFCLFFFTSHIYGFEKMLETKWEIDKEEGRMLRYEKSGLMFSGTETLDFPQQLKDFLSVNRKYNGDVYNFCLHEGFLPKHANEILRDLQETNSLIIFNADGTEGRSNAFYINNEEPKKIFFQYNPTLF